MKLLSNFGIVILYYLSVVGMHAGTLRFISCPANNVYFTRRIFLFMYIPISGIENKLSTSCLSNRITFYSQPHRIERDFCRMLSEQQCQLIETGLTEDVEPRKVAAYLCLHMGLALAEVAALRWQDIHLEAGIIQLQNIIGKQKTADTNLPIEIIPLEIPRVLLMPPHVRRYLAQYAALYKSGANFILTGTDEKPEFYPMQNILSTIGLKYKIAQKLSATELRNAFIRRCIQSGMDLYTLCDYIDIRHPDVIFKRFSGYFTAKPDSVFALERFAAGYVAPEPPFSGPKRMNLLILGAGNQGPVVKEIAEAIGVFDEIAFLDDNPHNRRAIGPLSDIGKLAGRFPIATASFGDGLLRQKQMDALESLGYIVPTLIHPSATVSPSAALARSVVVEARSIVSAGAAIGRGALVSSASVIETGADIGAFSHIGSSVTVAKNAKVQAYLRVPSGTVVRAKKQ